MMPMNQSMMPFLLQMLQGQGGGMPQMQNNAPSIPTPQLGQTNIAPVPQTNPIQQRPAGGAMGAGANGMQNIQSMYNIGSKAYNGIFGSTPQSPNPVSGAPSNNIGGNPAGSSPTGGFQPSSASPTMGYDPNASGARPGIFTSMANNMGMSQPGYDQVGSQNGSGLTGAYSQGSLSGVNGSQLGGYGSLFNGTAGQGANSAYGMAGEGANAADASSTDAAATDASSSDYASQMYDWLYNLL